MTMKRYAAKDESEVDLIKSIAKKYKCHTYLEPPPPFAAYKYIVVVYGNEELDSNKFKVYEKLTIYPYINII